VPLPSKAFILHLARATARDATVAMLRRHLSIESEIVDAVDGQRLSPDAVRGAYQRQRFRPRYPFALWPAEIGCFLTHRAAWRRIVEQDLDFAVIFEDDVRIDPANFDRLLAFATRERDRWDYVLLPIHDARTPGTIVAREADLTLTRPHAPPLGAVAQIVTRTAAERLLACSEPFDRPVDTLRQMSWITRQPVLVLSPAGIHHASEEIGGTTVGRAQMGVLHKLHHELARPIYRSRILARYRLADKPDPASAGDRRLMPR
jgi:GR25 family glycosyltransferase involved in LPS biosynthesis